MTERYTPEQMREMAERADAAAKRWPDWSVNRESTDSRYGRLAGSGAARTRID